jgi:hypothetical protein
VDPDPAAAGPAPHERAAHLIPAPLRGAIEPAILSARAPSVGLPGCVILAATSRKESNMLQGPSAKSADPRGPAAFIIPS